MSAITLKKYKASIILDLRGTEDDAEKVLTDIKEVLGSIGAQATTGEDLGVREFARAADHRFAQGHYLEVFFEADSTVPANFQEKFRLDRRVNRIFIQNQ
ncbi:MAG: 30S ribosomal protein S6 [Verrucomicrobiota bacterium]